MQTKIEMGEGKFYPGLHQKQCDQQVKGGDSPPLIPSHETPPGLWHPALGSSSQEGHGPVRIGSRGGHEDGKRAGAPLL